MLNIIISLSIFAVTLYFIVSRKVNRVVIAIAGALAMVVAGMIFGFYSQKEALYSIDFNTIGLLMGMMIIIAILKESGFFVYVAIQAAKFSRGKPVRLMIIMGLTTAFLSMFLDNVTTVLLVCPVTILVCDILDISPIPTLIAEIVLSNIGGVGTLIGDPPNMIIGSAAGFSFNDFLINLLPKTLLVMLFSVGFLCVIFRKELRRKPRDIAPILKIDPRQALKGKQGLRRALFSLACVFLLFFFHEALQLYPAFIALLGAGLVMLLVRPDPDKVFAEVEWSILMFFVSLFVIIGGIANTGVLSMIGAKVAGISQSNPLLARLSILWIAAIFAAFIGNIAFTIVMVPVISYAGSMGVDTSALWWMLAFGVGFGGNGLPISTPAGVIGLSISEKTRTPIDFSQWFKSATIVAFLSVLIISLLLLI